MSKHECPVVRVQIEPHPNADAIELARVGGYLSVVKKGQFKDGELVVYIPEQSVLPEWLLKHLGFWDELNSKGKLSGAAGNRVRAMKLRGVMSQGLVLNGNCGDESNAQRVILTAICDPGVGMAKAFDEGDDAAEWLGVTKYEPPVPAHMAGRVAGGDLDATFGYDFENIKKHPDLFQPGDEVAITEKIHGTNLQVGIIPRRLWEGKAWAEKCPDVGDGFKGMVTSKGQGSKGLMLDPADAGNLYVGIAHELGLWEKLEAARQFLGHPNDMPLFMFGEIFGPGIQDGFNYGTSKRTFRAFDMRAGTRSNGFFLNWYNLKQTLEHIGVELVPVLYEGAYDPQLLEVYTTGSTIVGKAAHIREGVVVKSIFEIPHPRHGRRIAKSVSDAYLELVHKKNLVELT